MRFLIDKKITISMIFIALTFLGYISYDRLTMELLPSPEQPAMSVRVFGSRDFDPTYVESEVIIPLEGAAARCEGVESVTSNVNGRGGYISVEFKPSVDMNNTEATFSKAVNEIARTLPDGFTARTMRAGVSYMEATNNYMILSVKGEGSVDEIREIVTEEVEDRLLNIEGVVDAVVYGGRGRNVMVELKNELCESLNITPSSVIRSISGVGSDRNFVGYTINGSAHNGIFVKGGYDDVSQIGDVIVAKGPIFLRDVATITNELKEPTNISRVDGKRAVSVSLSGESGVNIVELAKRTVKEIESINQDLKEQNISIVVSNSTADEIENNIMQISNLGLTGALIAVIILWFFLHNFRLVLTITLAIPISIFAAFNLFYAFGVTINSLTLIGIALAVGMLLDNSIVVLENIYRLFMGGKSAEESVIEGTSQVWRSIIASTLTTVTVFLPFVFTDNIVVGLIGKNLGVAIISTLLFSLLVALLLIPMLTYLILKSGRGTKSVFSDKISIHDKIIQRYALILKNVIRHPAEVITTMMVMLLITSIWAFSRSDKSGSSINSTSINIQLTLPTTNTIDISDQTVAEVEEKLDSIPEMDELRSMVRENFANLTIKLKEGYNKRGGRDVSLIIDDVWGRIRDIKGIDNIRVNPGMASSGGFGKLGNMMMSSLGVGGAENKMYVRGSDYDEMVRVAEDLKERLSTLDFLGNVNVSVQRGADVVMLDFDQIKVNSLGIGRGSISDGLNSLNDEQSSGTTMKFNDYDVDITVSNEVIEDDSLLESVYNPVKTMEDLENVQVADKNGALYNLGSIANIRKDQESGSIKRVDRSRELIIGYSFMQNNDLPDDIKADYEQQMDDVIAEYPMPSGIAIERIEDNDAISEFKFLIFASIILIYMILAIVFESLLTPLILLFSIPLAAIGSFVALILTENSVINVNTLTGFMILLGVVVNAGIILIDYINILRKGGYSRNRALLISGASRLRPIMITTITTIVALLPLAMGDNEYAGAIGAPFAITVIGGLLFSSLLTLIIVPTLYMSMEGIVQWYKRLPVWIYSLHIIIFVAVIGYVQLRIEGIFIQSIYIILAAAIIPGATYLLLSSIRIANSKIIPEDEPIVIEASNLVKIYDRPNKITREWQSAKKLRARLGLDSDCTKLSDLKDLIWKSVIAACMVAGAMFYFTNALWITLTLALFLILAISIWQKGYKYYMHRCHDKPKRFAMLFNKYFYLILAIIFLALFTIRGKNYGASAFYAILAALVYLSYKLARRAEEKNIVIERINGRFSSIRRTAYTIALGMPIIGRKRIPFKALKGVSFTINSGMFGLLGPNGAGKSTFMRIITGIYQQSYGAIWINNINTAKYREELQSLIGFLPQEFGMYESMSAWDFLQYQAILKGIKDSQTRRNRVEYVLKAVHMLERKDAKIGSFSGGMKQRIGIAMILLNLPRILVVDEPTAGLDPRERIRFRNLLVELSTERIVIFSTHIIEDIASSCNQVAVINRGELKYFGKPGDMLEFATDKVWSFTCKESEFAQLDHTLVANHMRNDNGEIKVRYISKTQPFEGAIKEAESLEDAYLCLLKGMVEN